MPRSGVDQARDAEADRRDRRPRRLARLLRPPRRRPCRARRAWSVRARRARYARWWTLEVRVDRAGQELRATEVDADHAAGRTRSATIPALHAADPEQPDGTPRVHASTARASRACSRRARRRPTATSCARRRCARERPAAATPRERRAARVTRRPRRALASPLGAVVGVDRAVARRSSSSARRSSRARSRRRRRPRCSAARGFPLTSPNNDPRARLRPARRRARRSRARRRRARAARTRSCSCASAAARTARLSIPRDTIVDIPGHGRDKINAAYAYGGAGAGDPDRRAVPRHRRSTTSSRSTSTNFPELIDAMGGIDYTRRLRRLAASTAASRNGGYTLRLKAGHDAHRRRAGARARAHAQERLQPGARTTSPARAASRRSSRR